MDEVPIFQDLDTRISTRLLTRLIVLLIAAWSFVYGAVLSFFHGASVGALGAGVDDAAAQRLVGAHMLLLVPIYVLIAWRPERYPVLHWVPFGGQLAVLFAVGYSVLAGDIGFEDGVIPMAVSSIFIGMLSFIWITEQRAVAKAKLESEEAERDSSSQSSDQPSSDQSFDATQ